MYISLHTHSEFSLLDGMSKVQDIVQKAIDANTGYSCITDHGNMYSVADHFAYADKKGIKAIAGFEAYVVKNMLVKKQDKNEENESNSIREHLILLAKTQKGYEAISKLCSIGATKGFYYRPRIDDGLMQTMINDIGNNHIIATSACIAGRIARCLAKDDMDNAIRWAKYYANLFKDNFYLEIQPTMEDIQVKVNQGLIQISNELSIPLVATTDSHYTNKEDAKAHELLLALQSKTNWSNPNRWKFPGDTFWIMNEEQITNAFKQNGHQVLDQDKVKEAINNSYEIACQCDVTLTRGKYYLPDIQLPTDDERYNNYLNKRNLQSNLHNYLEYQCKIGLKDKIKHLSKEQQQVYKDRLAYELKVIENMHFEAYFLVVQDYIKFANDNNIPTGPARGCFSANNKVKTNNGYKNICDIDLNDKVISADGQYHDVKNIFMYMVDEILNKIMIDDKQIISTKDHKILAIKQMDYDNGIRIPQWYTSDELQVGDYVCEIEDYV